jgi:hypothetical protein
MKTRFTLLTGLALSIALTPLALSAQAADKAAGAAKTVAKETGKAAEKVAQKTEDTAGASTKEGQAHRQGRPHPERLVR